MVKDVIDIVAEVVQDIDYTVTVKRIIDVQPFTIRVVLCDTKWLKVGSPIFANNDTFTVLELNRGTGEVLLSKIGTLLQKGDVGTINVPKFIHGTRTTANAEWLKSIASDIRFGVPLIWLHESIPGTEYDGTRSKAYDASVRLFFLDELNDPVNGVVNEVLQPVPELHLREQAAKPMQALVDQFYTTLLERYDVERSASNFRQVLTIFGNENQTGVYEKILDANLGGVEVRPTLTVYKLVGCCNK
jgi:hypothetical protein